MTGFSSFNDSLFLIARRAAELSSADSLQAVVAVVFSALAMEGFVNEFLETLAFHVSAAEVDGDQAPASVKALTAIGAELDERNAQLSLKLQVISSILTGAPLNPGDTVFQDFDLLIRLRNALVHLRPEKLPNADNALGTAEGWHRLLRRLASRGIVPASFPFPLNSILVLGIIHNPGVARWAYATSRRVVKVLTEMLPEGEWRDLFDDKDGLNWSLSEEQS